MISTVLHIVIYMTVLNNFITLLIILYTKRIKSVNSDKYLEINYEKSVDFEFITYATVLEIPKVVRILTVIQNRHNKICQ